MPGLPQRPLTADTQHAHGGLVQLDEHAIVDLPQTKQLQNLPNLEYRVEECNYEAVKSSTARKGVLMAAKRLKITGGCPKNLPWERPG